MEIVVLLSNQEQKVVHFFLYLLFCFRLRELESNKIKQTGVLKELENGDITGEDIISSVLSIAKQAEVQMGGTSGALYSYVLPFNTLTLYNPTHNFTPT